MLAVMCAWAVSACSAYDPRYAFQPRPLEVGHPLPGTEDRAASVLTSVLGVRKRDKSQQMPASVEVRMRVDNDSDREVSLDPVSLRLYAANLIAFPPPNAPGGTLSVPPHGSGDLAAFFPFPDNKVPGGFDLGGLSLRWTLDIGGVPSTGSATFTRAPDEYYHEPVGIFGFGWGWGWPGYYGYYGYPYGHPYDGGYRHGGQSRRVFGGSSDSLRPRTR